MLPDKDAKIWGPYAWEFIFTTMIGYDNSRRPEYVTFIKSLAHILPCTKCRNHYSQFLAMNPITDNTDLLEWLIEVHNANTSRKKTKKEIVEYFGNKYNESKVLPAAVQRPRTKIRVIKTTSSFATGAPTAPPTALVRRVTTATPSKYTPVNANNGTGYYGYRQGGGVARRKGGCGCNR